MAFLQESFSLHEFNGDYDNNNVYKNSCNTGLQAFLEDDSIACKANPRLSGSKI